MITQRMQESLSTSSRWAWRGECPFIVSFSHVHPNKKFRVPSTIRMLRFDNICLEPRNHKKPFNDKLTDSPSFFTKNSARSAAGPHLQDRTCSRWYDPRRPPGKKWSTRGNRRPQQAFTISKFSPDHGIVHLLHCFILHPFWLLLHHGLSSFLRQKWNQVICWYWQHGIDIEQHMQTEW